MTAKDIMTTQVMTIQPTTTIKDAIRMLVEIEISGLIVTDSDSNLVGVLTEKDLLVAYDFLGQVNAPIADYMNVKTTSVQEDTPLEEISRLLVQGDIRRVPVVRGTKVVGVVSRRDVLRTILKGGIKSS